MRKEHNMDSAAMREEQERSTAELLGQYAADAQTKCARPRARLHRARVNCRAFRNIGVTTLHVRWAVAGWT